MSTLGSKLKKERTKRKWTLEETAGKLGLKGFSTYANWEYDRREPDLKMIHKLAELYEVKLSYLLGEENTNKELGTSTMNEEIIKKLAENYDLDLSDPTTVEKLEKIIQIVFDDISK